MLELDRYDFSTENYFEWDEIQKKQLTSDILRVFVPMLRTHKEGIMFGIMQCIEEAEIQEDYEQADILNRCYKILEKRV